MNKDERDLLEVLKFELQFLEKGGYGRSPREAWRPRYIFEDSPTCMNYDCKESPEPCSHCVLTQLVPPELRDERIPCRLIPFNQLGENLDSLYRCDEQHEIEESVENWLRVTIATLEEARRLARLEAHKLTPNIIGLPIKGASLFQNIHPKCANPACATAFHWLAGGRFFRFRTCEKDQIADGRAQDAPKNLHDVKLFWLCERCTHDFTLVHDVQQGIVLRLLWPELPLAEARKELAANSRI